MEVPFPRFSNPSWTQPYHNCIPTTTPHWFWQTKWSFCTLAKGRPISPNLDQGNRLHCCSNNYLHCTSAKETWELLDWFLSPLCSIHIKSLRSKLCATKKKPKVSMFKYLMDTKATMDTLQASGSSITDKELLSYMVDGLDSAYRSFLTYLHFHTTTSFDELHIHLMQEDLLQHTQISYVKPIAFIPATPNPLVIPIELITLSPLRTTIIM